MAFHSCAWLIALVVYVMLMLTVLMAGQEHFLAGISLFLVEKLSPLVTVGAL